MEEAQRIQEDSLAKKRRAMDLGVSTDNAWITSSVTFLSIMLPVILFLNQGREGAWDVVVIIGISSCLFGCLSAVSIYRNRSFGYMDALKAHESVIGNPTVDQQKEANIKIELAGSSTSIKEKRLKRILYISLCITAASILVSLLPLVCHTKSLTTLTDQTAKTQVLNQSR